MIHDSRQMILVDNEKLEKAAAFFKNSTVFAASVGCSSSYFSNVRRTGRCQLQVVQNIVAITGIDISKDEPKDKPNAEKPMKNDISTLSNDIEEICAEISVIKHALSEINAIQRVQIGYLAGLLEVWGGQPKDVLNDNAKAKINERLKVALERRSG